MMKKSLWASILCVALFLGGCGNSEMKKPVMTITDGDAEIVVTRGEYEETYEEFADRLNFKTDKEKEAALSNKLVKEQLRQMTLNQLIFNALVKNDAEEAGIKVTDKDLKEFKQEHLEKIGGEATLQEMLKAEGISEKEFDQNLRQELLLSRFIEKELNPKVSQAEVKNFYEKNEAQFQINYPRARVSHILFKVIEPNIKQEALKNNPKVTSDEIRGKIEQVRKDKRQQAENVLAQVKKHPDKFEQIAREKSEDVASAIYGGDVQYLHEKNTVNSLWQAVKKTEPGTIYPEVVPSEFGYHVLKVTEYQEPHKVTREEAADDIRAAILQQKKQKALEQWVTDKKQQISIDFAEGFKPEGFQMDGQEEPPVETAPQQAHEGDHG